MSVYLYCLLILLCILKVIHYLISYVKKIPILFEFIFVLVLFSGNIVRNEIY